MGIYFTNAILTKVERLGCQATQIMPETLIVGAMTVAGFALRVFRLGHAPLSIQEIYTWDFSHQTLPFIWNRLSHIETNPPFYYLMMKGVTLAGDSEFLLRLPSVMGGTLAIPLVYILGRLGGSASGGAIGAALMALSAVGITYSRWARAYSLAQDACLVAAIGVVIIVSTYACDVEEPRGSRRETFGWVLLTCASVVGFYLHYTFLFEILVLQAAIVIAWLVVARLDKRFLLKWAASVLLTALAIAWGVMLARSQSQSADIAWIQVPSLRKAIHELIRVDGYGALAQAQGWASLILIGAAFLGLAAGWRRSPAVLVSGALFVLFPLVLFILSQSRPMFLERTLVPPGFAVYLLAGYGCVYASRKLSEYGRPLSLRQLGRVAILVVLILPAAVSAADSLKSHRVLEPYDKASAYLAATMKPGDVAAGPDGVIYYRRRGGGEYPYFKLVVGDSSVAQITYGSPTTRPEEATRLVGAGHSLYLVLWEGRVFLLDGKLQLASSYVRAKLGLKDAPIASFGSLGIYRLPGACTRSVPCLDSPRREPR